MTKPACPNGDCSQVSDIGPDWNNVQGMCDCLRSCDSLEECIRRIIVNGLYGNDVQSYIATKTCEGFTLPISRNFVVGKDVWFSPVSQAAANQLAIANLNQQVAAWEINTADCVTSGNCPNNTVAGTMCVGTSLYQRLCDGSGGYKQGLLLESNSSGCGAMTNPWAISTISAGCISNTGRILSVVFSGAVPAGTKQYSIDGISWLTSLSDPALVLASNNTQYTLYVKITDVNGAVTTANKTFQSTLCSCSILQGLPILSNIQNCSVTQGLPVLNVVITGQFTALDHALGNLAVGSVNNILVLPAPNATGSYLDVGGRRLDNRATGVKVYANGTELSIGATFNNNDVIKVDIDPSVAVVNGYLLFGYSCLCNLGTYSNQANVSANIVAQQSGTLSAPMMMLVAGKSYTGNTGAEYVPASLKDLYYLMVVAKPVDGVIHEDVKFSNLSGIGVGSTVHNMTGALRNVTGYFGYFDNNNPMGAKIVNGVVVEIGAVTVPSGFTDPSFVLFPKVTSPLNNLTDRHNGWLSSANTWRQYLDFNAVDHKISVHIEMETNAADGYSFTFTNQVGTFFCRPYFRINRGPKIMGLPKNYQLSDKLRGSVVEVVIDVDIASTVTDTEQLGNINIEFNGSYILKLGK